MELFSPLALRFSLTFLFFSFSFFVGRAIDCGGNKITKTITVDQSGKGDFTLIQPAIDSINVNNDQWVKVYIKAGTYREKVQISMYKRCIFLEGEGKDVTTITNDGYNNQSWNTSTFVSSPPNVIVIGITFENRFRNSKGTNFIEAPAAAIFGDKTVFYKSGFIGFQDTLLDSNGRHYFKDCYIQGEIDFIFGSGQSYYKDCVINATQGNAPPGFITAQARGSDKETSGFVFRRGFVFGDGEVKLGRAYGAYSRVIFHGTYLSKVVSPIGWDPWHFGGHESQFTYAEVDCFGPGANNNNRVKWTKALTSIDLRQFSLPHFVNQDGWLSNLPVTIG